MSAAAMWHVQRMDAASDLDVQAWLANWCKSHDVYKCQDCTPPGGWYPERPLAGGSAQQVPSPYYVPADVEEAA